jgi:hypothetical protein
MKEDEIGGACSMQSSKRNGKGMLDKKTKEKREVGGFAHKFYDIIKTNLRA